MKYKDNLERILFYSIKFKVLTVIVGLMSAVTIVSLMQYSDLKQHAYYIFIPAIVMSVVMIILFLRAIFTKKWGVTLIYTVLNFIACIIAGGYLGHLKNNFMV